MNQEVIYKTAVISLNGLGTIDKPENIKTVKYTDEKRLIAHLKELQSGYSEEGERGDKPKIKKHSIPKPDGKMRMVIDCYTSADWHYVAHLGMSIKKESGKPIETLN